MACPLIRQRASVSFFTLASFAFGNKGYRGQSRPFRLNFFRAPRARA